MHRKLAMAEPSGRAVRDSPLPNTVTARQGPPEGRGEETHADPLHDDDLAVMKCRKHRRALHMAELRGQGMHGKAVWGSQGQPAAMLAPEGLQTNDLQCTLHARLVALLP